MKASRSFKPPLYLNVFTIFFVLVIILAGAITVYNHSESSDIALRAADQIFSQVSGKLEEQLTGSFGSVPGLVQAAAQLPPLAEPPLDDGLAHPTLDFLLETLEQNSHLYSLYSGFDADGAFLQAIGIESGAAGAKARAAVKAPASARFAVRSISVSAEGERLQYWRFLDADRKVVGQRADGPASYDPRARPWYRQAKASPTKTITTDLYIFSSTQAPGLTMAHQVKGGGAVFGVDITLSELSTFLAEQRISETSRVFLFDDSGRLIAHPDETMPITREDTQDGVKVSLAMAGSVADPLVRAVVATYNPNRHGTGQTFSVMVDEERYIAMVQRAPGTPTVPQRVAVVAKASDFTQAIDATRLRSLLVSLGLVIVTLPLIYLLSRRIAHALSNLAQEAEKIQDFDLDGDVNVQTSILEVHQLAGAIDRMKNGLRTFKRYVPADLVRDIIASRVTPELGGERQELTILFTDVANFTTISESVPPEDLMIRTSIYFEVLGEVIHRYKGSVDKYIGDAIMAFWNAPVSDPDHVFNACAATLLMRRSSTILNKELEKNKFPIFYTRFGLHCGETVVGNVGSSDRMNYTAVGASVNLASRLEGMNKFYGTQILVSETVQRRVSEAFQFRVVDRVLPKGAVTPVEIYELLGATPNPDLPQNIWAGDRVRDFVTLWARAYAFYLDRDWERAHEHFSALAASNPDDELGRLYAERCAAYRQSPPPDDWNGVAVMKDK